MKATKYTATHEGFTFKRSSARTYTNMVIYLGSVSQDRKDCELGRRSYWKINQRYYRDLANGINRLWDKYPEQFTPEKIAEEIADAKAWLEKGEEGHVADALARFEERLSKADPKRLRADGDTYWIDAGWCGRPDLAQKLAAKHPTAVILEAKP